ncbi:MAG: hypothetical protein HYU63_08710 [Armatimonadetes bacterium]|nr:hypothetical protein [Armatimonadota bacterium]
MKNISQIMEKYAIPGGDLYQLPDSKKTFPDGAHYRMELSGIERPSTLEATIKEMHKRNVPIHKLICTVMGATLLTKEELKAMAEMAESEKIEIIITPGPRPLWDVGRQIATPEGALSGLRMRGQDQIKYLLKDIFRCIEIGFKGFLVWDEGVLWLLNQMKEKGDLPKDIVFKVSIFAGHANAAGAKLLQNLGATTFNPVADLTLPQLAALRAAIDMPMDLHVYLFDSFGGFNRLWETPELARVCAPCYFKIEPGVSVTSLYKPWVGEDALAYLAKERIKYAQIIKEFVEEHYPQIKLSPIGAKDLAIPKVKEKVKLEV